MMLPLPDGIDPRDVPLWPSLIPAGMLTIGFILGAWKFFKHERRRLNKLPLPAPTWREALLPEVKR